jgi:3-methyladenine DNA glycosylase AlkD
MKKQDQKTKTAQRTAKDFIKKLTALQSDKELENIQRYFKSGKGEYGEGDVFIGIKMGDLFALSKTFLNMKIVEIAKLLDHKIHEIRAGGVSIMNQKARSKKISNDERKELYDLYLNKLDRINNWDLVDLGAGFVIGGYLFDKPRNILYKMAKSKNMWERRTAIVSTSYFIRKKETDDTFDIAELLVDDKEDLIHKAAGGWIREAGKSNPKRLIEFLDRHAATMPRTMLRYAIEKLNPKQRTYYMSRKELESVAGEKKTMARSKKR